MASLSVSTTAGLDMARLWPGTSGGTVTGVVTQTTTQFRITIDLGGGDIYDLFYFGSGFTYDGETATGGTYTSVQVRAPGGTAALAILSSLSQPLADIYTVSLATLVPLAGIDNLSGNSSALSNDILRGGDGNDRITDTGGNRDIRAGAGDDLIILGNTAGTTGTVNGGSGTDAVTAFNLTGVTLNSIEILQTQGSAVTATAAQLASFSTIWTFPTAPTQQVSLVLAATGAATTANLAAALNSGGGPRNLSLTGSTDDETITSGDGADQLRGGAGDDVLKGGLGDDRLEGQDGNDTLIGGGGNDQLLDTVGNNSMSGGAGNDTLTSGGAGTVSLNGDGGDDLIVLSGFGASGVLNGGGGTDTLRLLVEGTSLSAFDISSIETLDLFGRRLVSARAEQWMSFDRIIGPNDANGAFRLVVAASGHATMLDLGSQFATSGPGGGPAAFTVLGSDDDERMIGGAANDVFFGGNGGDTMFGKGGNDQLIGDAGDDILLGGAGDDILGGGTGLDRLSGGDGNDTLGSSYGSATLINTSGGSGRDVIIISPAPLSANRVATGLVDGGGGRDMLVLRSADSADITQLTIRSIETLEVEQFDGFAGGVTAFAHQLASFSTIRGYFDGNGQVRFILAATGAAVTLDLAPAVEPSKTRELHITGSSDRETLFGSDRTDVLRGGGGVDRLIGRDGDDTLAGGTGADRLDGGQGGDTYHYDAPNEGSDVIVRFQAADRFSFDNLAFGNLPLGAIDPAIFVSGTTNAAQDANDRFIYRTTDHTLWYDSNGSASGELNKIATIQNGVDVDAADIFIV